VPWTYRFNTFSPSMTHPGDNYHRLIGRCEQVIVNGYPTQHHRVQSRRPGMGLV